MNYTIPLSARIVENALSHTRRPIALSRTHYGPIRVVPVNKNKWPADGQAILFYTAFDSQRY